MIILVSLFFAHFLADFTHLASPYQQAKRFGKPLSPIFTHALWHGVLMAIIIGFSISDTGCWLGLFAFEVVTHFLIDTLKGRANGWYPVLQDPTKHAYWYAFGFDQFLHACVIAIIYQITILHAQH